jgi:hypothetical protein
VRARCQVRRQFSTGLRGLRAGFALGGRDRYVFEELAGANFTTRIGPEFVAVVVVCPCRHEWFSIQRRTTVRACRAKGEYSMIPQPW